MIRNRTAEILAMRYATVLQEVDSLERSSSPDWKSRALITIEFCYELFPRRVWQRKFPYLYDILERRAESVRQCDSH